MEFRRTQVALAVATIIGAASLAVAPVSATAAKQAGKYVSGDFHNHTTCSDGSVSIQKLVRKATDTSEVPWGLDWFVQAGHGGSGNRNCTLVEDESLGTPAYPFVPGMGPTTTWQNSGVTPKGDVSGTTPNRIMWRWQAIQEFTYPTIEYLNALKNRPLFVGVETVVPGHEHTSMSVITGQIPNTLDSATLPSSPGYTPLGNATALAQWEYCFDRADTDTSRGNDTGTNSGNNWSCVVPNSPNSTDPALGWRPNAQKLIPAGGAGTGVRGHLKTLEALKWMVEFHPNGSYYVPAHLERAGPFNPDGNNGFNVEHLRNFNNTAPAVAFGFETQPGHGASGDRGEYRPSRNNIGGVLVDSVGGTTYGGTGVYGAYVGGVWDALLGEGRNWWFFASSDWHNRGMFAPDDRRSTQDFYPGEYQRDYVIVRNGNDKLRPQPIVDGLRTGNSYTTSGQLIDRLAFIACASYPGPANRSNAAVETLAVAAATGNTDIDASGCATMGEKLVVRPGAEIVVAVALRDPEGANYSPYTFANPSLAQVNINQPMNMPVLDHVDLIGGMVSGYRTPGSPDYAGQWPNTWLENPDPTTIPPAARNLTAAVITTFNSNGSSPWMRLQSGVDNTPFFKMSHRIARVTNSQYVRLRGTNLPPAVPSETDADGNPLPDLYTNARNPVDLRIPCTSTGSNLPPPSPTYTGAAIDGCPDHLPVINGVKYSAFDVAAWADIWFYSNPIYIEVLGATKVAGVK